MSCKKELDVGYPQVTIIVIEWTKTFFFSGNRKWIELKIRQNSTAKFNQFSWQKPICKIQVLLTINTILFDHDILVNTYLAFSIRKCLIFFSYSRHGFTNYQLWIQIQKFQEFFFFRTIRKEWGRVFFEF